MNGATAESHKEIDLDESRKFTWNLIVNEILPILLNASQAINHYLMVPDPADQVLEEVIEYTFRSITSILYGFENEVSSNLEIRK